MGKYTPLPKFVFDFNETNTQQIYAPALTLLYINQALVSAESAHHMFMSALSVYQISSKQFKDGLCMSGAYITNQLYCFTD